MIAAFASSMFRQVLRSYASVQHVFDHHFADGKKKKDKK
jgi:hypothetical protein